MVFTGYELSEIEGGKRQRIKEVADILIVGRYDESQRTLNRQWIGSENQQILFLTERYDQSVINDANYIEVGIDENGAMTFVGFPTEGIVEKFISTSNWGQTNHLYS